MKTDAERTELLRAIHACSEFVAEVENLDLDYEDYDGPFATALRVAEGVVFRALDDENVWREAEAIANAARREIKSVRPASVIVAAAILIAGVHLHVDQLPKTRGGSSP